MLFFLCELRVSVVNSIGHRDTEVSMKVLNLIKSKKHNGGFNNG
jgi:hypothetical protein